MPNHVPTNPSYKFKKKSKKDDDTEVDYISEPCCYFTCLNKIERKKTELLW